MWPLGFSGAASAASLTLRHHRLSLLLSHPCSYSSCHRTDPAEPPPWMRARDGGRRTTDTRGQFLPPLQPPWLESDSGPSPRRESRLGLREAGLRPGTVPQVGSGRGLALSKPQPLAALLGGMLGGRGRVLWEGGSSCSLRSGGSSHDSILSRWPGTHGTLPAACVLISPPVPPAGGDLEHADHICLAQRGCQRMRGGWNWAGRFKAPGLPCTRPQPPAPLHASSVPRAPAPRPCPRVSVCELRVFAWTAP